MIESSNAMVTFLAVLASKRLLNVANSTIFVFDKQKYLISIAIVSITISISLFFDSIHLIICSFISLALSSIVHISDTWLTRSNSVVKFCIFCLHFILLLLLKCFHVVILFKSLSIICQEIVIVTLFFHFSWIQYFLSTEIWHSINCISVHFGLSLSCSFRVFNIKIKSFINSVKWWELTAYVRHKICCLNTFNLLVIASGWSNLLLYHFVCFLPLFLLHR